MTLALITLPTVNFYADPYFTRYKFTVDDTNYFVMFLGFHKNSDAIFVLFLSDKAGWIGKYSAFLMHE